MAESSFVDTNGNLARPTLTANNAVPVELASGIAGENLTLNKLLVEQQSTYLAPITASTAVKSGSGRFFGLICTASTSLVLRVWDNNAASGTKILDSLAVSAGNVIAIPNGPTNAATGMYVEFVSGSGTLTPFYQ